MNVSGADIRLVQKCWFSLSNHAQSISSSFYQTLFAQFPHYRRYFTTDQKVQGEKLMQMINIIINGLNVWEKLEPEIIKLGEYHATIADLTADDYDNIATVLIEVMCEYKGEKDPATMLAWKKTFDAVSSSMLQGQQQARVRGRRQS